MTAIRNATPEDELARAGEEAEPETGRWSQLEQLVAMSIDVQRQSLYAFHVANSDKKHRKSIEPPEPIRRPGARPPKKKAEALSEDKAEALYQLLHGGTE